jgi:ketosteroid isomerase-like protein
MSETTPQEQAPLDVIGRYLDVMRSGDRETGYTFFAEDVSFHIPDRSPFAGHHQGRAAAVHYIESAIALAHEGEVELELIDTLTSRERVALLLHERFNRHDGVVDIRRANVYRIAAGQIVEVWIFEADQYAVDALFGA